MTRHIDRHMDSHGQERWRQDYSLAEVVQELGIICRVVLVHGLNAFEDAHPDAPKAELRQAQEQILRFFEDTLGRQRPAVRRQAARTTRRAQPAIA